MGIIAVPASLCTPLRFVACLLICFFITPACAEPSTIRNSVLDRLNPLLEPDGALPLTECGTFPADGEPNVNVPSSSSSSSSSHRVIRPHPNFRLFLTADPSCGEVSRAMRNRCVEVSLPDVSPAVSLEGTEPGTVERTAGSDWRPKAIPSTEHVADLLSLVRAAGLRDAAEATAMVAVHSALISRRLRGKIDASSGEGPASRSLLVWAELVAASRSRGCLTNGDAHDVLLRCMLLAYPTLSPGVGSAAELKSAEDILKVCMSKPSSFRMGSASDQMLDYLVSPGLKELACDGAVSLVEQDLKLLKITSAGAQAGFQRAAFGLLSLVVDGLASKSAHMDLRLEFGDEDLLHVAGDVSGSAKVIQEELAHAAVLFARKASPNDRFLRSVSAASLITAAATPSPTLQRSFHRGVLATGVGPAVSAMLSVFLDSEAWAEVSAMLSDMVLEIHAEGSNGNESTSLSSLGQATALAQNHWSPADPRVNSDLFRCVQRACCECAMWTPCLLLLDLIDASLGRRLLIVLAESAELEEARNRVRSGRGGEDGLGWLGVSCLVCEGGRDSNKVGAGRGGSGCPETRLARSALSPYLLPLLRAVDDLVGCFVCRQAAELVIAVGGYEFGRATLGALQTVLDARDSLSGLLSLPAASRGDDDGGAGASIKLRQRKEAKKELLFEWDPFLVSWRWMKKAIGYLRNSISASSGLNDLASVSAALAALSAVCARVDSAVLQHAGGAAPTMQTFWKYGPRAAAPSSAAGATALGRLCRLADEFRILPVSSNTGIYSGVVSLDSLMRQAHPSLSVQLDTRRELLHALCTLQWASSNEQLDDSAGVDHQNGEVFGEVKGSGQDNGASLAARLPHVMESALQSARTHFKTVYKGTRLGVADRTVEGLEYHQDDLEFGTKFDAFDTEAAEAVANATLVVVSDDSGRDNIFGQNVLRDWALVQLSPLTEHWIAVEECRILSLLADLDVAAALAAPAGVHSPGGADTRDVATLMTRVARLRSAILATPSLSPSAARPFQTLLWAWDNSNSWPDVCGILLKRLLPVALESFGRRIWENVVGTPGAFSLRLAPPEMIAHSPANPNDNLGGSFSTRVPAAALAFTGPAQMLVLARSAFLLRLLATAMFRGGVVPTGDIGKSAIDLTLMNASARLCQFRAAARGVRDLGYGGRRGAFSSGALKPLVRLSWARLCRTLCSFDSLLGETTTPIPSDASGVEFLPTFARALLPGQPAVSWAQVESPLRAALESCKDDRLVSRADDLVVPAARQLSRAMTALVGPVEDPTLSVKASAGLGMALLGCLKLTLLLPSSPVDPGLRPAIKKQLLCQRMKGVKAELTARRWALRLEGGGDVSPEVGSTHYTVFLCFLYFHPVRPISWCLTTPLHSLPRQVDEVSYPASSQMYGERLLARLLPSSSTLFTFCSHWPFPIE